jgi:adenylylsulfate kinase
MNQGFVIWLTGLPGSGKTTIASLLQAKLKESGIITAHLESDQLRKILTPQPSYSRSERDWFYSVVAYIGKVLSEHGVNVLLDATANLRKYRDEMRAAVPCFVEIYVRCPLDVCAARDPKGIYAATQKRKTTTVPGIQEAYEEPEHPEVMLDSERLPAEQAAQKIIEHLQAIHCI